MSAVLPSFAVLSQAFCVACEQDVPALPSMTPERLFFLSGATGAQLPVLAAFMPDGSREFAFDGRTYTMPERDWAQFLQMRLNFTQLPLDNA